MDEKQWILISSASSDLKPADLDTVQEGIEF